MLSVGRVPDGPAAGQQPAQPRHRGARPARHWRSSARTSTRCLACEEEPGLGNGGLGRLAACYLDSLATLERPAIGYGIRYEFGIFDQEIRDGWQVEKTDNWLIDGNPWEIDKPDVSYRVNWGGHTEAYVDDAGHVPGAAGCRERVLKGVAYDTPIQGYGVQHVQHADALERPGGRVVRVGGVQHRRLLPGGRGRRSVSETVSKVLYPNDEPEAGKRLRLLQQYFFVSCSLQDSPAHPARPGGLPRCTSCRSSSRSSSTTPTPSIGGRRADAAAGRRAPAATGTRRGRSPSRRSATPTTRCCRRRWRPGRWRMFGESLPRHLEIIYEINRALPRRGAREVPRRRGPGARGCR